MAEPKVSIIIPAYNVEDYIEACLDSVLAQSFADFEVIAVDDGSGDGTGDILDAYAAKDQRIKVIHKPNGGVSAARNDGIKAARGEYFLFFDGDDFAEPYTVGELVQNMQEQKSDVLLYGYHRWRDGEITQTCLPVFPEGIYEGNAIITDLISRFVGFSNEGINKWLKGDKDGLYVENPALWRCMAKADIIRANNLEFDTSLKIGEDTVFISDLLSCAKRCYVLHKCYYYLVYRESSATAAYEHDAVRKLDGKQKILISRNALTGRILERSGINIKDYWRGNTIMSGIELAFLFSKKGGTMPCMQRYRAYLSYAGLPEVREAARLFRPSGGSGVKRIPLLMFKWGRHAALFTCAMVLNLIRYEFNRGG
jgi:glycosyltransferase involved in cell wall biosynthesis